MNLLKALSAVSGMTLLSRITGLMRTSVQAAVFGVGAHTDAFEAAFRLPNILRRMFAEGAFSQAFVPILAEYQAKQGQEETRRLISRVSSLLAAALLALSVLGVLAAPWLAYLLASGFAAQEGKMELTTELIRVVFPYILFISLVSLAGGVLNVHRRFGVPAFTPVLLNLSLIGSALFLAPHFAQPIMALAWGVIIGGVAQLLMQIWPLYRLGLFPRPDLSWRDEGVQRILRAMGPAMLGVSAAQISILVNTQLASMLGDGAVSWITYADRLMEFPTAMLGVALGTVLLPSLARHHGLGEARQYSELLDWGLRFICVLALPAALALGMIGVPLIATINKYGAFTAFDVSQTRDALFGYSLGLIGLIGVKVLAPGFFARQDMKTPVKISVLSVAVSVAAASLLMHPLAHAGLTLATSLGACVNAGVLLWMLRRKGIYAPLPGWGRFFAKLLVALAVLALTLHFAAGEDRYWLEGGVLAKVGRLAGVVLGGATAYFATLWIMGFRPRDFLRSES
ncbi:putative peptidoglycan lipid II flippase [Burkholderiales bacterium]|nr:MAG: murein biosynthesis integral membrane protein MurJ [Burkholderiales bacterium]CAG0954490.1 putative peptidoglycan lipid II flippase [Burkholderiales bacterium]